MTGVDGLLWSQVSVAHFSGGAPLEGLSAAQLDALESLHTVALDRCACFCCLISFD